MTAPARRFGPAALVAALLSMSLAACVVSTPEDMEIPSPDGEFLLDIEFSGGGLTFRPGIEAELSLRHHTGTATPFASIESIRGIQVAWTEPHALRICAEGSEQRAPESVMVSGPDGDRTFDVTYACPALSAEDLRKATNGP